MKIPRYEGTNVNISSGRSLTTGIGSSQGVVELGKTAMNAVSNYATKKNSLDAKLRRLEINTNVQLSGSMLAGESQGFFDSLNSRTDYLTPDNWLKEYETNFKKSEKNFKTQLDEQTFKEFQPTLYQNYFETKSKIVNKIADQKLVNAKIALDETTDTYKSSVETATNLKSIKGLYDQHTKLTLKSGVTTELFNDEIYQQLVSDTKDWTNSKYIMFQVTQGAETISPDGDKEIDQKEVLTRLSDKNFKITDIDGKELTPDDDVRKKLIADAKTDFDNQDAVHKKQKDEKDKVTTEGFTDIIIGLENNDKTAQTKSKTFLSDLANSDLDPSDKLTLKNAYNTAIKNVATGTKSYDSPEGIQAKTLLTSLVLSGAIDTHKERMVIVDLMGKGLIKPEYASTLFKKSVEMTKSKNAYKKDLIKSATRMLLKEIGASDKGGAIDDLLNKTGTDQLIPALLGAIGTDNFTQEAYNAVNNLYELIAQGEQKGFSYENMLMNPRNNNYIINDLVAVYNPKINDTKFQELQNKIDGLKGKTDTLGNEYKTHYILPAEYFTSKVPALANVQVPPRLENENINDYIKRVQGLIKTNNTLPSVITGDNIETLDISDLFVTDED